MNDNGYVYVLMNPSMENLVKIGKSTRTPQERAKELSATTGVPTPFVVVYEEYFESCTIAEQHIHTYLESKGFRVSKNREFFEIPIKEAIDAVVKASDYLGKLIPKEQAVIDENDIFSTNSEDDFFIDVNFEQEYVEPWQEMFDIAESHYYGFGDEIVDYVEALNYYIQAIKLGSIESYRCVEIMYNNGEGVREDKNKAFQYFKEGAKKGEVNCYAEMGKLFNDQENIENAKKCWNKYFNLSNEINFLYAVSYLQFIYKNELQLDFKNQLITVKNELIDFYSSAIESCVGTEFESIIPSYKRNIDYVNSNLL